MNFETLFENYMAQVCAEHPDPSHDLLHVRRVVTLAKKIAKKENAKLEVVIPAAYLHDCVYIPKTDERRSQASRLSADKALELLREWQYPEEHLPEIHHAIAAHSFSAQVFPETLEAKVVQDADRLDAMGAIGLFRCFALGGLMNRPLYSSVDPFCRQRTPDDSNFTLDHFFKKLLLLEDKLHTVTAKSEGSRRTHTMKAYLLSLQVDLYDDTRL